MPDDRVSRPGRPGRKPRLSRDQVLNAAIEIADQGGIEALTMRSIGERLGAEAMSLYRHVESKDDVLDGIVDKVYEEIDLPISGEAWRDGMRRRAVSTRRALNRHPWAGTLMESRVRPGPANLRHHDAVTGMLFDAGFSAARATRAYNLVDSYIYGFAVQENSLPFDTTEKLRDVDQEIFMDLSADVYPHLTRVALELMESGFSYADEFEAGLDLILDALERMPRR